MIEKPINGEKRRHSCKREMSFMRGFLLPAFPIKILNALCKMETKNLSLVCNDTAFMIPMAEYRQEYSINSNAPV
jgi:acyl CoA:acetate/3-ketoacid CoA transferase alpha subunit